MANKVLVAYATKHGSTAGIAQKIGEVLVNAGLDTDVLPVKEVKKLSDYRAVIIGSAVYMGKWRRNATRFLKRNTSALADKDVWVFSSGPTDKGDPYDLVEGWRIPEGLKSAVDKIQPHDLAIFHGRLDAVSYTHLTLPTN